MKYVKTYESFIFESTTDGSIESLVDVSKIAIQMGIFDDKLFSEMKDTMISGVKGSLKSGLSKVSSTDKNKMAKYANSLLGPLESAKDMKEFLIALIAVGKTKDALIKNLALTESLLESKMGDWLKKAKNATVSWWKDNAYDIAMFIARILIQILVEILFAVLRSITKSDIETPKMKFGGGSFGGGGASGKW